MRDLISKKIQNSGSFKIFQILGFVDSLASKYPSLVEKIEIGKSTERRPLVVLKISSGSNPNKKAIWMDFGIHAREWVSSATGQYFLNEVSTPSI